MELVILIVYAALGYWAAGKTVYANKIRFGTMSHLFFTRLGTGLFFGWILIPVSLIKVLIFHG